MGIGTVSIPNRFRLALTALAVGVLSCPLVAWGNASIRASSRARIAFIRSDQLWLMNADGSDQKAIPGSTGVVEGTAAWSPDGMVLAFWRIPAKGKPRLAVFDPRTWKSRSLFTETLESFYWHEPPSFSRDGRRLYFGRHIGEFGADESVRDYGIWGADNITGRADRVHPGLGRGFARNVAVSPDGRWIAFEAYIWEECAALGYVQIDGKGLTVREDIVIHSFCWLPDSQSIAVVTAGEDDPYQSDSLAVFDLRTRKLRDLVHSRELDPVVPPLATGDGKAVLYKSGSSFIYEADLAGSQPKLRAWLKGLTIHSFSVRGETIAAEVSADPRAGSEVVVSTGSDSRVVARNARSPVMSPR